MIGRYNWYSLLRRQVFRHLSDEETWQAAGGWSAALTALGWNLRDAGALCAAWELGQRHDRYEYVPTHESGRSQPVGQMLRRVEGWSPGCGRPA